MRRTTAIADADVLARDASLFFCSGVAVREKGGVQSGAVFVFNERSMIMNCSLYSSRTSCQCCGRFLKTVQVVVDGGEVVLLVPERVFDNFETLCLCIAQSIPVSSTNETVWIQSGLTSTARYQLRTTTGNPVYSYQLKSRTLYKIIANSANNDFVINPRYLCKTINILPQTPPTVETAEKGGKVK